MNVSVSFTSCMKQFIDCVCDTGTFCGTVIIQTVSQDTGWTCFYFTFYIFFLNKKFF